MYPDSETGMLPRACPLATAGVGGWRKSVDNSRRRRFVVARRVRQQCRSEERGHGPCVRMRDVCRGTMRHAVRSPPRDDGGVDVVDAGEWSSVLNVVVNVVTVRGRGRGRERGHSPWSWS